MDAAVVFYDFIMYENFEPPNSFVWPIDCIAGIAKTYFSLLTVSLVKSMMM